MLDLVSEEISSALRTLPVMTWKEVEAIGTLDVTTRKQTRLLVVVEANHARVVGYLLFF